MPRIEPVDPTNATPEVTELLAAVKSKMGKVPNLISTMATSPSVANAYLGFSQSLSGGTLPARLREQIALAVGEANGCGYCVAAHTLLGKGAGLSEQETRDARQALPADEQERAALAFALEVVRSRGAVSDEAFDAVRRAGFSDGEIGEIVANVALNVFTNYFNLVARTDIDFPAAPSLAAA